MTARRLLVALGSLFEMRFCLSTPLRHRLLPRHEVGRLFVVGLLTIAAVTGCGSPTAEELGAAPVAEDEGGETAPNNDIGEFDPDAGLEVHKPDPQASNPFTAALEMKGPLEQRVSQLGIQHAVNLFQALEGRYPKDHEEFMQRIIRDNQIRLPSLPDELEYQYDVGKQELVIVVRDGHRGE